MYYLDHRRDVVRIPPERLGPKLDGVLTELAQQQFEGKLVDGQNLTVTIQDVRPVGEGHIIHGDGAGATGPVQISRRRCEKRKAANAWARNSDA